MKKKIEICVTCRYYRNDVPVTPHYVSAKGYCDCLKVPVMNDFICDFYKRRKAHDNTTDRKL